MIKYLKNLTFVEIITIISIIGIFISVFVFVFIQYPNLQNISYGYNQIIEIKCSEGYEFIIDNRIATQIHIICNN